VRWKRERPPIEPGSSPQWKGTATLSALVDGFMVNEVTTRPWSELELAFSGYFDTLLSNAPQIAEQLNKVAPAPASSSVPIDTTLAQLAGKYPRDLLEKRPDIEQRLNQLLGASKARFDQRFGVQSRLQQSGDYLLAAGCQQRVCLPEAAVFVLNLRSGEVHAGIVSGSSLAGSRTFAPKGSPVPEPLSRWMTERRQAIKAEFGN
jgi:hypothetical protein